MKFKTAPFIAYLCLMPLLIGLGIWQLNRADEKRSLLTLQSAQQTAEPLSLSANSPDFSEAFLYKPISVVGVYDNDHQYLLDNQINKGRAGYFVLTPLLLKNQNKAVLVNRGWILLGKDRSVLPDIKVQNDVTTVTGRINRFPGVGLKMPDAEVPGKGWPSLVQVVDAKVLANKLGYPLYGFQIELDQAAANGFTREWRVSQTMTPEKHVGYAVQWFLLAITLTVLFFKYGFIKDND
jgi:surfeit locus 1 family protein